MFFFSSPQLRTILKSGYCCCIFSEGLKPHILRNCSHCWYLRESKIGRKRNVEVLNLCFKIFHELGQTVKLLDGSKTKSNAVKTCERQKKVKRFSGVSAH